MFHKHALGMVVVGAPLVRPVQGGAVLSTSAEPIATHSPTVPSWWCVATHMRRAVPNGALGYVAGTAVNGTARERPNANTKDGAETNRTEAV